jgi:hypothetical protein
VNHGEVMPYAEIQCDQIRTGLAGVRLGPSQKDRQRALGLALGRVVAHELYHVLAKTTAHAEHGLAKYRRPDIAASQRWLMERTLCRL